MSNQSTEPASRELTVIEIDGQQAFAGPNLVAYLERIKRERDEWAGIAGTNAGEIERLRADIESLKSYTGVYSQGWRSPYARPAADVPGELHPSDMAECHEHALAFPVGDDDGCPECYREKTGHYPRCGVYEGTQRGPCSCSTSTRG